jgi:hypothetical protein
MSTRETIVRIGLIIFLSVCLGISISLHLPKAQAATLADGTAACGGTVVSGTKMTKGTLTQAITYDGDTSQNTRRVYVWKYQMADGKTCVVSIAPDGFVNVTKF